MQTIVIDLASAPLEDADHYLEGTVRAPGNYKDPVKIAEFIAEKKAERLAMAATDMDLARITALGFAITEDALDVRMARTPEEERLILEDLSVMLKFPHDIKIVTFGGHSFDLPLMMRRARYLGIKFPILSLDRYRSNNVDLCELLSDRDKSRMRSLSFYVRRMGWTDLTKILSGAEEAQVPVTGRWEDLEASIRHDVTATYRLAQWCGVLASSIDHDMSVAAFEGYNAQRGIRHDA